MVKFFKFIWKYKVGVLIIIISILLFINIISIRSCISLSISKKDYMNEVNKEKVNIEEINRDLETKIKEKEKIDKELDSEVKKIDNYSVSDILRILNKGE